MILLCLCVNIKINVFLYIRLLIKIKFFHLKMKSCVLLQLNPKCVTIDAVGVVGHTVFFS